MHKNFTLSVLFIVSSLAVTAQTNQTFTKQFRIESGFGYANAVEDSKQGGTDFWMQFDYRLAKEFSIAMEGDFMHYKQPNHLDILSENINDINVVRNNFSMLVKYHFLTSRKFDVAFASGWTYCIVQADNFIIASQDSSGFSVLEDVTSYTDYRIPLIAQATYSLSKKLELTARFKFDLSSYNQNTYSTGIGLDLKL